MDLLYNFLNCFRRQRIFLEEMYIDCLVGNMIILPAVTCLVSVCGNSTLYIISTN
jgi:hypothetical protein